MNPLRRGQCSRAALALFSMTLSTLMLAAPSAHAWSDKPVRLIVPAPPGGSIDIVARMLADQLGADLGQPVVVDNKPGAGGAIAVQNLLAAANDGGQLMVTASNVLTEVPHVLKSNFDPLKDLVPLASVATASMVLVGNNDIPAQDLKGMVDWARRNPGKLSIASYSAGTSSHYAAVILNRKAGLDLQHVPFLGSPPALTQVIGGQVPLMFDGMATSLPQLRAGKIKVFALAGKVRSPLLPQVPTLVELGYPELVFGNWLGVVSSSRLSPEMQLRIREALIKAGNASKVRERLLAAGFEPQVSSGPELVQSTRTEFERNAQIVRQYEIRLN